MAPGLCGSQLKLPEPVDEDVVVDVWPFEEVEPVEQSQGVYPLPSFKQD